MVVCKATPATTCRGTLLPFTLAQVVALPRHAEDDVMVAWWVPSPGANVNFKKGRTKQVMDLFGPWRPMGQMTVAELTGTAMPEVLVSQQACLEMNFSLTAEHELPFEVFEALRKKHSIDVTGLSLSLTKRGNVYRRFALLGCTPAPE